MPRPRDTRHWLADVRESCDSIALWSQGKTLEQFVADKRTRRAIEREFEIIGEALKRIIGDEAGLSLRFPQYRDILTFRNIITHGYHLLNYQKVWETVTQDISILRKTADELLAERPPLEP